MSMLPSHIRRRVEETCKRGEHPSGMSVHDGKARFECADIRYMLLVIDKLEEREALQQGTSKE